jgi:zinc transporter 1/2/3
MSLNVTELFVNITQLADGHEDHDHTPTNIAKGITMALLFVISMTSGLIPLLVGRFFNWSDPNRDPRTNLLVSSLLSFGGGALLCTTFMHLLPEIDENIAHLQGEGMMPNWPFSITNLLMSLGFFIIYLVEEIVHAYLRKHQKKQTQAQDAFIRGHSARESIKDATLRHERENKDNSKNGIITVSTADLIDNEHGDHSHHHHHNHSHIPIIDGDDLIVSSIRGLLIVLALSVHELFEGLAVGLEHEPANVWYLFASVSAHKVVIAFCIGVELLVHKTQNWLVIVYVFVYAIVSPLGIGIGIWVSNSGDSDGFAIANVILQGLASGTLLYVIFFEILAKHKEGVWQYIAVLVGYFLMFGLKFVGKN